VLGRDLDRGKDRAPRPIEIRYPSLKLPWIINGRGVAKPRRPGDAGKVGGPTRMPMTQKFVEDYFGKKIERGIDPMDCVAMGAAIQAAIIKGEVKDVLLLDVTPLSLGIETLGGVTTTLIEKNTTVPTKKSQIFSTAADNQTAVTIRVLQGERPMANDNVELGRFDLVGIPLAPRGIPHVEVAFDIDANGIVHVSAKDLGTGREQSIRITAPKKLSKQEIHKMVQEAEKFAAQDAKKKEEVEIVNHADSLIYTTEKSLRDFGDKISQKERADIETGINDLKQAIKDKNIDRIKSKMEVLTRASHKLAEEIYKQASPRQETTKAKTGEQPKEDIIDAEYEETQSGRYGKKKNPIGLPATTLRRNAFRTQCGQAVSDDVGLVEIAKEADWITASRDGAI